MDILSRLDACTYEQAFTVIANAAQKKTLAELRWLLLAHKEFQGINPTPGRVAALEALEVEIEVRETCLRGM